MEDTSTEQTPGINSQPTSDATQLPAAEGATPSPASSSAPAETARPEAQPSSQPSSGPTEERIPTQAPNANRSMRPAQGPGGQPPPQATPSVQDHPAVQRAGLLHSIAESLAGGPRYKTVTDVNTGTATRVPVPLSGREIGMAIALEAISGSLAGLKEGRGKGPGAAGMGGMEQGQKIVAHKQQMENQQNEEAQQNLTRHYQVAEANMRMLSLAQTVGRGDQQQHDDLVKMNADHLKYVKENSPEFLTQEHASEAESKDLQKYPLNEFYRVADGTTPRIDENGNDVFLGMNGRPVPEGTPGAHRAFDNTYSIVNKNAKTSPNGEDGKSAEWVKQAVDWGLLDKSWLNSAPGSKISGPMAAGISHKVSALNATQTDLQHYYDTLNGPRGADEKGPLTSPPIKDEQIASLIDGAAAKYHIEPALLRGLVLTESGNPKTGEVNPNAKSPKGALGLGQLMPATAKMLGIQNPLDPEQNLDGTAHYLSDLMAKHGGDPKAALAAYHGIGSDGITTDSQYVKKITDMVGMDAGGTGRQYDAPNLREEIKKDPRLGTALDKFQGMLNQTGNREAAIGELQKLDAKNGTRFAGAVARLYGGHDALHTSDVMQKLHDDRLQGEQKTDLEMEKKTKEEQGIIKRNDSLIDAMLKGDKFDLFHIATMRAYDRETIVNEAIKRAEQRGIQWNPEDVKARIDLYNDAAGSKRQTAGSFANSVQVAKTSLGHMGGAMEALDRLKAKYPEFSDVKALSQPMQWFNEHFSTDSDWRTLKVALHTGVTDWQNLLNNQHALTQSDKDASEALGSDKSTLSNAIAGIREMAHTAAVRIAPLNEKWKDTMGANYPDLLNEEAVKAIKKIGNPEIERLLGDVEVGGNLRNSSNGQGTPGRKVKDILAEWYQGDKDRAGKPGAKTSAGGKITIQGKTYDLDALKQQLDSLNGAQWKPPADAPPATGVPDGKVLKDQSGNVVGVAKGGVWTNPQQ